MTEVQAVLSKYFLIFIFLQFPSLANVSKVNTLSIDESFLFMKKDLSECVNSLSRSELRTLLNLSQCLFQFRQLVVSLEIDTNQYSEVPELFMLRKELDKYLNIFLEVMLKPKTNSQVPLVASRDAVKFNSRQLIELLAILQFSPVKTSQMLNETIISYNNLVILLGILEKNKLNSYPVINSIGMSLQETREKLE